LPQTIYPFLSLLSFQRFSLSDSIPAQSPTLPSILALGACALPPPPDAPLITSLLMGFGLPSLIGTAATGYHFFACRIVFGCCFCWWFWPPFHGTILRDSTPPLTWPGFFGSSDQSSKLSPSDSGTRRNYIFPSRQCWTSRMAILFFSALRRRLGIGGPRTTFVFPSALVFFI